MVYQRAFFPVFLTAALAPLREARPRCPSANILPHRAPRLRKSCETVRPALARLVSVLADCPRVVLLLRSGGDPLETHVGIAEVMDPFNVVSSIVLGASVGVAHDGGISVSWQTVAVVVSIVIHTNVARCVAVVHGAEAVASFVEEEAGSVEGDGGGGVVLRVRHLEPGAEDQAPWQRKWIFTSMDIKGYARAKTGQFLIKRCNTW